MKKKTKTKTKNKKTKQIWPIWATVGRRTSGGGEDELSTGDLCLWERERKKETESSGILSNSDEVVREKRERKRERERESSSMFWSLEELVGKKEERRKKGKE